MKFYEHDFHWRDLPKNKKESKSHIVTLTINFLNSLPEEQQKLIEFFGKSNYRKGLEDGDDSGYE